MTRGGGRGGQRRPLVVVLIVSRGTQSAPAGARGAHAVRGEVSATATATHGGPGLATHSGGGQAVGVGVGGRKGRIPTVGGVSEGGAGSGGARVPLHEPALARVAHLLRGAVGRVTLVTLVSLVTMVLVGGGGGGGGAGGGGALGGAPYIITRDQSDAVSAGIFSRGTNQTQ
eukprot:1180481-Prorocentrum_minimum.AAC.1